MRVVIQGKAVNLFETPRELIAVEASLFDAQNQTLATRRLLCGNTLDLFQLQVLAREEIDAALENEAGIGANNISLQTGSRGGASRRACAGGRRRGARAGVVPAPAPRPRVLPPASAFHP